MDIVSAITVGFLIIFLGALSLAAIGLVGQAVVDATRDSRGRRILAIVAGFIGLCYLVGLTVIENTGGY